MWTINKSVCSFLFLQDLVTANTEDRNWKGIIVAVVVICTILALIVTSVILLTPPDEGPRVRGRRFELDDIFGPKFQPLRSNGTWVSGGSIFSLYFQSKKSLT